MREALRAIESTGRETLAELRRLLAGVRPDETGSFAPAPGLENLDALAERVRAAGLAVELAADGRPAALPPSIDLSAYRIVQEALTNTLKHAGATTARVTVRQAEGVLEIDVVDDGRGAPADAAEGHGIIGMRERAALFGGELRVGPAPGGGFAVHARIPIVEADVSIRVLLVDDQALVRSGFRLILETREDLEVVGEAEDGREAVELARRLSPDVILMDVRMPNVDGVEATRRLAAAGSPARVLILTTFDLDEYVYEAIRAGASGFLLKDVQPAQLVDAIRVVAAGEALLAPTVTRRLLDRFADQLPSTKPPPELARLTERELEILTLLAEGLSNAELAERLFLSETTVKTHVSSVLRKLELRDRVQAVVLAYKAGLARPHP